MIIFIAFLVEGFVLFSSNVIIVSSPITPNLVRLDVYTDSRDRGHGGISSEDFPS